MEDTENYKKNDLGLKYLNEHKKLKIVKIDIAMNILFTWKKI